jgi:hypothetical protein
VVDRGESVENLKYYAEPLIETSGKEVAEKLESEISETVECWNKTRTNLRTLCNKYHDAVDMWKKYHDASIAINDSIQQLDTEEVVDLSDSTKIQAFEEKLKELEKYGSQITDMIDIDMPHSLKNDIQLLRLKIENVKQLSADAEKSKKKSEIVASAPEIKTILTEMKTVS